MLKEKIIKRFWSKVNKNGMKVLDTPCWEYTGYRSTQGYGRIRIDKQEKLTHRLSWEIHNSLIPEGQQVLHKCDNPPCCNPEHLFLGTQIDNLRDAREKGRMNTNTKVRKEVVIELFKRYSSYSRVAKELGISRQRVYQITSKEESV